MSEPVDRLHLDCHRQRCADHRLLLPASVLYGAALLTLADLGARMAGGIPVGIVTALMGAPFFLWLLRRSRDPSAGASA